MNLLVMEQNVVNAIAQLVYIDLPIRQKTYNMDELFETISQHIQYLIHKDFNGLINLLYKLDIDEDKLRHRLENTTDYTEKVLTEIIIERQLQRIKQRQQFTDYFNRESEEEKW